MRTMNPGEYTAKHLAGEIRTVIADAIGENRTMPATDIVATILERHPLPPPYDASAARDFVVLACTWMVREQVHKILATLRSRPGDRQLHLPGFSRLLPAYIVLRAAESDGEVAEGMVETIVPTAQMTDAELEQKAREYDNMADGCRLHANELRRYRLERGRQAA